MTQSIKVDDFGDLHLRIKTLGYPDKGESIMISLMNKDEVVYNIFTDNYDANGFQYWLSELPEDTRIDAFIWTHPDEDHSIGIDKLLDKFDPENNAAIYLPTSLTSQLLKDNEKLAALQSYEYLKNNYNKNRHYKWNEISLCEGEGIRYLVSRKIIDRTTNDSVTFRIGFMLPYSAVINRRVDKPRMNDGEMNDLSLFFIIELNKVRYIFSGDLAEINLQFLEEDYLSSCRFIKIPHHGSKEPIKLIDRIQGLPSLMPHSVSTVFGNTHPYDDVLDLYAKKCLAVYSTGRGNKPYGIVELDYNVKDLTDYNVTLFGNAIKVRP